MGFRAGSGCDFSNSDHPTYLLGKKTIQVSSGAVSRKRRSDEHHTNRKCTYCMFGAFLGTAEGVAAVIAGSIFFYAVAAEVAKRFGYPIAEIRHFLRRASAIWRKAAVHQM